MKGMAGQALIIGTIIALVSGVIGFVIIDQVLKQSTQEYSGTAQQITMSTSGTQLTDCESAIVVGSETLINATDSTDTLTISTDYNLSGCSVVSSAYWDGNAVNVTGYRYTKANYFSSSLSRTIGTYVVPLGLLGILAMAAFMAMK